MGGLLNNVIEHKKKMTIHDREADVKRSAVVTVGADAGESPMMTLPSPIGGGTHLRTLCVACSIYFARACIAFSPPVHRPLRQSTEFSGWPPAARPLTPGESRPSTLEEARAGLGRTLSGA